MTALWAALTLFWRRMGLVFLRVLAVLVAMLACVGARADVTFDADMRVAQDEISAGHSVSGTGAARRAYGVAQAGTARVRAARLVAAGYYARGRLGLAEWWLRRALEDAPGSAVRAALVREIGEIRSQNRFRQSLRFSVAPSSNINNGFDGRHVLIWGIPFVLSPEARALSGIEFSGVVDLGYRLSKSQARQTEIGVLAFGRSYVMSRKAQKMAPDRRGRDFSFGGVNVSLRHQRQYPGVNGPTVFSLGLGQTWYGGQGYDRGIGATVFQKFRLDPRTIASGFMRFETRQLLHDGHDRNQVITLGFGTTHRLGNGNILDFLVSVRKSDSADVQLAHSAYQAQIAYHLSEPVPGVDWSVTAGVINRIYPVSIYGANGRRDMSYNFGLTATFPEVLLRGMTPFVMLEMRRTNSNIPLFKRRTMAIRMGIRSAF